MKLSLKSILKPALPLIIICLAVSLVLSLTNWLTADRIAELQSEKEQAAMQEIFPECKNFTKGEIRNGHTEHEYYIADGYGLVFNVKGKGYGGEIIVMVGVNNDCTVKAVKIINVDNETVGLGQNVKKPEFYEQFNGMHSGITTVTGTPKDNEIKALTNATYSSKGVADAVNEALECAEEVLAKGGNQ